MKQILWGLGFLVACVGLIWFLAAHSASTTGIGQIPAVNAADHVRGNPQAKAVLIEYGDFQCPACAAYYPYVEQIVKAEGDKMEYVFRHFPLPQHVNALPSARASEAASLQGKFWEMYNLLYTNQTAWSEVSNGPAIIRGYAQQLGLDMAKFDQDINSSAVKDRIQKDLDDGTVAHLSFTPSFILNGKLIQPQNPDELKNAIEAAAK